MNENERPLDAGTPGAEQPQATDDLAELQASIGQLAEEGAAAAAAEAAALEETVEAVGAAEVEAAAADLPAAGAPEPPAVAAEDLSGAGAEAAGAEPPSAGAAEAVRPAAARSPRLTDRLAEGSEYDPDATQDDRLLAALAYGAQLVIPVLPPLILLISEASKSRPFQRYHAVQALALGLVVWGLGIGLATLATIAAASVIGLLCLCFIVPVMIVLWLLPLYYALLAYGGKRFRIPGLTQFLQDQGWL